MSGYVSKEEVKSLFGGCVAEEYPSICKAVHKAIDCIPNADVRDNVHGEWIEKEMFDGDTAYECSECRELFCLIDGTPTDNLYNFCPNCGADMRGKAE